LNDQLLKSDVQRFIIENINTDVLSVTLGKSPFPGITSQELAQQLNGCKKALKKLPLWHQTPGIYYPPSLNLEQSSSEATARYKAGLVSGEVLVDLTGGFGVDDYFFSRRFREVHYCEQSEPLAEIASHNFKKLGAENIHVHKGDGVGMLAGILKRSGRADCIYLDPSRRKADRSRVFRLEDCQPPVLDILPELLEASPNLLLKTSPLLDLAEGEKKLQFVREIHVVGVKNEVKELIWWLRKGSVAPAERVVLDLHYSTDPLRFSTAEEAGAEIEFSLPMRYLYEPNASMLKAGSFKLIARRYGLFKLHPHTHLYTSDSLITFPGRRFEIQKFLAYKPGKLGFRKANVSTRNFPETVARIRKRNRIRDGGNTYLFFTRCIDESLKVLCCEPVIRK
jgi:hypothetical protein